MAADWRHDPTKSILLLIRRVLQESMEESIVRDVNPDLLVAAFSGTPQQFERMLDFGESREKRAIGDRGFDLPYGAR